MVFAVGVVLFALGITISIALHECGHMWTAQATRHEGAPLLHRLRAEDLLVPSR